MAYLYRHIRKDKNQVFYIGVGLKDDNYKRAYSKNQRNKHWKNIVNNTDYEVEIIIDNLDCLNVFEKEKEFINIYGRNDLNIGTLCNLTDGGEGIVNFKHSEEFKKRMSELRKGSKNPFYGKKHLNKKNSKETIEKIKLANTGNFKGEKNPFYGKKHSEENKKRMSEIQKGMKRTGSKNKMSVKVINTETKEIFNSIREAAEKSEYRYSQVKSIFDKKTKHNYTNLIRLSEYNKKEGI